MHYGGLDVCDAALESAEAKEVGMQSAANAKAGIAGWVRLGERGSKGSKAR